MSDFARLFLLLALAGGALTAAGAVAVWYMEENRRMRRALHRVLGAAPDSMIVAHGRGQAAGFDLAHDKAAVSWDGGAWCLVYRLGELQGAELLVDGQVAARAFRGEPRRALDQVSREAQHVALRLIFDDAKDPDFILDLWLADDGRPETSPAKATQEANRWIARVEALLRRPVIPRPGYEPPPQQPPAPAAAPAPPPQDDPPWDDDDEDLEDLDPDDDPPKLTA